MAHNSSNRNFRTSTSTTNAGQTSHYGVLDVLPTATEPEIRRAYREKSKLYHPDTTDLPADVAIEQFRQLNQAYAVLSQPDQRLRYDQEQARQKPAVSATNPSSTHPSTRFRFSRSAYLDGQDRSLSSGEIFALFILALTFLACLLLAILVGVVRGEIVVEKLQQVHPDQWWAQVVSSWPHPSPPDLVAKPSPAEAPTISPSPRFSFSPPQFSQAPHEAPH